MSADAHRPDAANDSERRLHRAAAGGSTPRGGSHAPRGTAGGGRSDEAGGAPSAAPVALSDEQDVEVNYYVLVPFTTAEAALWGAGHIEAMFDCHVVSRAAVDQDALLVKEAK